MVNFPPTKLQTVRAGRTVIAFAWFMRATIDIVLFCFASSFWIRLNQEERERFEFAPGNPHSPLSPICPMGGMIRFLCAFQIWLRKISSDRTDGWPSILVRGSIVVWYARSFFDTVSATSYYTRTMKVVLICFESIRSIRDKVHLPNLSTSES